MALAVTCFHRSVSCDEASQGGFTEAESTRPCGGQGGAATRRSSTMTLTTARLTPRATTTADDDGGDDDDDNDADDDNDGLRPYAGANSCVPMPADCRGVVGGYEEDASGCDSGV